MLPEFVTLLFNIIQYGNRCFSELIVFRLKLKLDVNWQNWTEVLVVIDLSALSI